MKKVRTRFGTGSDTAGHYLAAMRFTHVPWGAGVWPAFWMNGMGKWPDSGERPGSALLRHYWALLTHEWALLRYWCYWHNWCH